MRRKILAGLVCLLFLLANPPFARCDTPEIVDMQSVVASGDSLAADVGANDSSNVLVLCVTIVGGSGSSNGPYPQINEPSGWTTIRNLPGTQFLASAMFWRIGDGRTSQTVSFDRSMTLAFASCLVLSDVDTSDPVDASGGQVGFATTLHSIPTSALFTTQSNDLLIGFWGFYFSAWNFGDPVGPGNMSILLSGLEDLGQAPGMGIVLASSTQVSTGSTGFKVSRTSLQANSVGILAAFKH